MNATHKGESSWRRRLVGRVQNRLWLVSALLMLLVASWVIIGRQLMLLVPEFRVPLEEMLEERLQAPLEIRALRGHMDGLSPVFVLEDLRLPASEEGQGLTIEHVALTVDVLPSLMQRDLRLRQLLVRGVDLHIIRSDEGRVRVRGLEGLIGKKSKMSDQVIRRVLELFYRQNRLVLDQVRLSLDWAGLPPVQTRDLELALVNSGGRHKLSLRFATVDQPRELALRLSLDSDAYKLDDINGELYARLNGDGWERWITPRWPFAVAPESVDGEMVVWSRVNNGRLDSATLRLAMERVGLRDKRDGSHWPITGAFALARLEARDSGYLLSLSDLTLATPEGEWRAGEAGVWWNGERGDALGWRALARRFNLSASRSQLLAIPFALPASFDPVRKQLSELAPRGHVQALYAAGDRHRLATFSGRVREVGNDARDRIPGVGGLSGWFAGTPDTGLAMLDTSELSLNMPRLYQHPLRFGISGPFRWRHRGGALFLESGRVQAANEDASGDALMGARLVSGEKPELRLLAAVHAGDGAAVPDYVPGNKLKPALAEWLKKAFEDGRVTRGRFLYQGPVKIDPSRQQDRTFQMGFNIRNFRLHYLDEWPEITELKGTVQLDGRRVQGRRLSGRLMDTRFSGLSFDVPPVLPGGKPELIVAGRLEGPAGDLSRLFRETPLKDRLPAELQNWQLTAGELSGHLVLRWPLAEGGTAPRLLANGRLGGASLVSRARDLRVTDISAPFAFDLQDGLDMASLEGTLFGDRVTGSVVTRSRVTRVSLDGAVAVPQLRRWFDAGWLGPVEGRLGYNAQLSLPWEQGDVELQASSPLTGVQVRLPAPLGKNAETAAPARVRWTASSPEQELYFDYGRRLGGRLWFSDKGLQRGHVVVGQGEPGSANEPGILVTGRMERLAVSPWVDYLGGDAGGGDWPLRKIWLKLDTLGLYGVDVPGAGLTIQPAGDGWSLELDSEMLAGSLRIPAGYQARGDEPLAVTVDHLRLRLPEGEGGDISPREIPTADVNLKSAEINGVSYGSWRAQLRPLPEGVQFQSLQGNWRSSRFNGRLDWTESGDGQQSRYLGSVHSDNLARTLKAWELEPFIEAENARSVLDVRWPASPFDVDYTIMEGTASVEIEDGRIPETNRSASALRVLGIFNISSLSRRLRLDFSDLYKKGLSFDSISGDFRINGPIVSTSNLVIKSPSAEFRIRGSMNIKKETLDHYMEVTLPVSSNLYAGCLAGPAACAGIFVFERLWGNKLEKMTTLEYRVTGTWENPRVKETRGLLEGEKD